MAMKSYAPTPEHLALMADLKAALGKHPSLPAEDLLAVVSQLVGNLIALQDQRRFTPDMAMAIVAANIEAGNREALSGLLNSEGSA